MKDRGLKMSMVLAVLIMAAFWVAGCGGGASSAGSGGTPSADSGTVAVYLADAPSDAYDSVVLYVSKVMLLPPASQPDREAATVFESDDPDGYPVDLLKYRYQDFLLSVNNQVEAGTYAKIRLVVTKVTASGGPCDDSNIKIPSGKVDLVLREALQVDSDAPLALRLDVDVNKSFNLHEAGNSGKCIFRPVVFVEQTLLPQISKCPKLVKGSIQELLYENQVLSGFILALDSGRGTVTVSVTPLTYLFDEAGAPITPADLSKGQDVYLKGPVAEDGSIDALMIVMGDVLDITGTADSGVDMEGLFDLKPDPGQVLVNDSITVDVSQALIMSGCDEIADSTVIVPWSRIDVIGKVDLDNGHFLAAAALVDAPRIQGRLVSLKAMAPGYELGIIPSGAMDPLLVSLPAADLLYLAHDGNISIDQLKALVDCSKELYVDAKLTFNASYLEAERVEVKPERVTGIVQSFGGDNVILIQDDEDNKVSLQLQANAQVILDGSNGDEYVTADRIEAGDRVTAFGLSACDAGNFFTYIICLKPGL